MKCLLCLLLTTAGLIAAALLCSPALSAAAAPKPLGCLIEPYTVAEVGSPVIGVIASLHVERGDSVRRGQALAVLRADVERHADAVAGGPNRFSIC